VKLWVETYVAQRWDSLRTERNQSLDAILENLGQQHVPPNLHLMSSGSSLFGSQHSAPDITEITDEEIPPPDAGTSSPADVRSKWKTLRDFVDGKAIEDALEQMEEDRNALDVTTFCRHAPEPFLSCLSRAGYSSLDDDSSWDT